ncbi:helix-turn-helix transcriptional regulator [Candidatus Phycosocius spiralis]|uniref:Transcriptional regulator n=1 Tax=Candidatus Phycosocius spiralis TaxID=2815099 RepID=A0ABQ4PWA2_9PROT|nr:helix-turn-helix transcriptional regulator [Candidatus Phycosocius spiralis]GIU67279.1 transcriptional regulator [Candidatus Phycosocius spiralis]
MNVGKGRVLNQLRMLRTQHGLTQQEFASLVGATRQTIVAVEAEKYAPSLELAFRIARVLGVPFETVFQFKDEEVKPRL